MGKYAHDMTRRRTIRVIARRLRMPLQLLVSASLLALVISWIDLPATASLLAGANLWLIAAMFLVLAAQVVLSAYKLLILVRCRSPRMTLGRMIRIVLVSLFLGVFIPGAVGIEAAKMWGVARDTADRALSFTAVVMDRLLGMAGLMTVILIGVVFDTHGLLAVFKYWAVAGLLLIVLSLALLMSGACRRWFERQNRAGYRGFIRDKLVKVYACIDDFRTHRRTLFIAYLLGIAYNLLRAIGIFIGAKALGLDAPLAAFLIIIPVSILAIQLPMTVGGFGVRELAYVSMLKLYGLSADAALAISFLQIIVGWSAEVIPGGLLFLYQNRSAAPAENAGPPHVSAGPEQPASAASSSPEAG